jgi:hypothetical protein
MVTSDFALIFALLKFSMDEKLVARLHHFRNKLEINSTAI